MEALYTLNSPGVVSFHVGFLRMSAVWLSGALQISRALGFAVYRGSDHLAVFSPCEEGLGAQTISRCSLSV